MAADNVRKLKLQVQISVDGFVARLGGELDWMTWKWDDKLAAYITELTDSVDTILLGRKMADGFISYWSSTTTSPDNPEYAFGKKMIDKPKIVFTKTLDKSNWVNTSLAKGGLVEEVNRIKKQPGKDIIVYGDAGFVSSLIKDSLIDEYNLFINPAVIGKGLTIFNDVNGKLDLRLIKSIGFESMIVLNCYIPALRTI